jgi:aldehyde dehydrogenase (NAD+)
VPTFATHAHLRALGGVVGAADRETLRLGAAESVKRTHLHAAEDKLDWFKGDGPEPSLYALRAFLEFKTTWHPVGA